DPRGVVGQAFLLLLASAMALPLLSSFDELQSAAGPISLSLLIGAFLFGLSMQIADGCGSGTLYKAGSGVALNMGILPLFALGSFLGSVHLPFWLSLGSLPPVLMLDHMGPLLSWALTALLIGLLILLVRWHVGPGRLWIKKPLMIAAIGLALLATLNLLLSGQAWGVVYGFGLWAAKLAVASAVFDPAHHGFWGLPQHQERLRESLLLDVTSITNLGILAGAFAITHRSSLAKGSQAATQGAQPQGHSAKQWAIALTAGFVMGYSSRLAFGCNVGAMLSGITTGSLHGWIWLLTAFVGTMPGIRLRDRYGF
ncbi:MAG: YeeE/YedE family protein, partial [Betaproteobacteria bacterium]|nr:YeeE/YedE family protein [Betaproteobacteria bacterium]